MRKICIVGSPCACLLHSMAYIANAMNNFYYLWCSEKLMSQLTTCKCPHKLRWWPTFEEFLRKKLGRLLLDKSCDARTNFVKSHSLMRDLVDFRIPYRGSQPLIFLKFYRLCSPLDRLPSKVGSKSPWIHVFIEKLLGVTDTMNPSLSTTLHVCNGWLWEKGCPSHLILIFCIYFGQLNKYAWYKIYLFFSFLNGI